MAPCDGFDHVWRWRTTRYGPLGASVAGRFGEACQVFARGRDGKVGVEFADGTRVVAPHYAVRRTDGPVRN